MSSRRRIIPFSLLLASPSLFGVSRLLEETPSRAQRQPVRILRGDGSGIVSWESFLDEMRAADVVLLGEIHGHGVAQMVLGEAIRRLLTEEPGSQLSLEFYARDEQQYLDQFISGSMEEEEFRAKHDKGNFDLIKMAKAAGRPVIASNAPRSCVAMARSGYDELQTLPEPERSLFSVPDGDSSVEYRERFINIMSDMGISFSDGMFRAQRMWDCTMAESIVKGVDRGNPVIQLVGYFHVLEPGSELIRQMRIESKNSLIIKSCVTLSEQYSEVLHPSHLNAADFIVYVGEMD